MACMEMRGQERDRGLISLRDTNSDGIHKESDTVMWCQSAGVMYTRDTHREQEEKTMISRV